MSRHLTPLMRPTSLQPSLTGPRDAPRAIVHTITTPEEAAEDNPPATAPTPNLLESTMSTQQRVIDALTKKSPQTRAQLAAITGMAGQQLGNALFNAKNSKKITFTGKGADREYSLAGSAPSAKATKSAKPKQKHPKVEKRRAKPAPESFADGVKARERELDAKPRSNGTDMRVNLGPDALDAAFYQRQGRNAAAVTDFNLFTHPIHEATALPCRAIATAAGGALITRGNLITAELSAEELNVLHALRA